MDLPHGAERDFYATIGYIPLGNHAIRADMVERLAAMARAAVRDSRENARRAQQEKQEGRDRRPSRPRRRPRGRRRRRRSRRRRTDDEISEWAIVAAAFGESEPAPKPAAPEVQAEEAAPKPRRRAERLSRRGDAAAEEPKRRASRDAVRRVE